MGNYIVHLNCTLSTDLGRIPKVFEMWFRWAAVCLTKVGCGEHAHCFGHEMENVLPPLTFVVICKSRSSRTCCLPRFTLRYIQWNWGWGQVLCGNLCVPEQQFCSCFPVIGTGDGKTPTAGIWGGQTGENHMSQTKIWSKVITKG